jgi:hypothetical protein
MKRLHLFLLPLVVLALSATSCQTTAVSTNAFAQCKSVGQCYLATVGTYNAAQNAALEVLHNADTPPSVRDAIKSADSKATPVIEELSKSYTLYKHVKADLNTCAGSDTACQNDVNAKILSATTNVNKWLAEASPLVSDLLKLAGGES